MRGMKRVRMTGGGGGDTDQGQEKKVCKGEMVLHIENDCRRS